MVAFSTLEHWNNDNLEIKSLDFSSSRGPPSAQDIKIKREREREEEVEEEEELDSREKTKKKMMAVKN